MEIGKMFNGLFGKIQPGLCRLSVNGDIAIKTSNGYKTYNVKTGRIVNCDSFVFNIGEDMFFVLPTNKVETGDIILVASKPKCVREVKDKNAIEVINYEDNSIETIIPERHIFLGSAYFYGKIVSMFGNTNFLKGTKGTNKMLQFMMMNEIMKGNNGTGNMMSNMLPMMMFSQSGNMFGNMFEGMFDFGLNDDTEEVEEESEV